MQESEAGFMWGNGMIGSQIRNVVTKTDNEKRNCTFDSEL